MEHSMSTTISGDTGVDKFEGTTIAGHVIQVANYTTGAMSTGTALIPWDNTIPQITEGTQFLSLAFTPKKENSKLKITVTLNVQNSADSHVNIALFSSLSTDAIGTAFVHPRSTGPMTTTFITMFTVSSISSITFSCRAGSTTAGTITFNGMGGAAYFGGALASSITIEEIAQ